MLYVARSPPLPYLYLSVSACAFSLFSRKIYTVSLLSLWDVRTLSTEHEHCWSEHIHTHTHNHTYHTIPYTIHMHSTLCQRQKKIIRKEKSLIGMEAKCENSPVEKRRTDTEFLRDGKRFRIWRQICSLCIAGGEWAKLNERIMWWTWFSADSTANRLFVRAESVRVCVCLWKTWSMVSLSILFVYYSACAEVCVRRCSIRLFAFSLSVHPSPAPISPRSPPPFSNHISSACDAPCLVPFSPLLSLLGRYMRARIAIGKH